jgi:Mrp family chromosome partitioning ATPase
MKERTMADSSMAWVGKTMSKTVELEGQVVNTIKPNDESLQTAARLKVVLGTGRIAAFMGLAKDDGTTPLLIEIGIALASIDPSPVLLIDANCRRPTLHKLLDVPVSPGLIDCLGRRCSLNDAIRPTALSNLFLLPLGEAPSNLSLHLTTPEAEGMFGLIRERYRNALVDTGVNLQTPEGVMISSMADGVVIAMAAGKRRQHEILQCREGLDRLKLRLLGIVLTRNSPRIK